MKFNTKLLDSINRCLIPKLSKNYEESANHVEFDLRNDNLDKNFKPLKQCLVDLSLIKNKEASTIIASLYILYTELKCDSPWNNEKSNEYGNRLNFYFEVLGYVPLESVLVRESVFNTKEIFDKCLETLHSKLTSEDFKKYPGLIEVYCSLLADVGEYNVELKPQKVFPVLLLLMDDYVLTNRIKGLLGCKLTLQCMKKQDFDGGNYYEVLYRSMKRSFSDKELNITALTHACLKELCLIFPDDVKHEKLDDMYSGILHEIMLESNLYRKAECMKFTRFLIKMHKINCASRNIFKTVICDCLELCVNDIAASVILLDTLACLDEWIVQCWCIWQLSTDYKIISTLLKVLYTCQVEHYAANIQRLIIILICLNKESDQLKLMANLEKANNTIDNKGFKERIEDMKLLYSQINSAE